MQTRDVFCNLRLSKKCLYIKTLLLILKAFLQIDVLRSLEGDYYFNYVLYNNPNSKSFLNFSLEFNFTEFATRVDLELESIYNFI